MGGGFIMFVGPTWQKFMKDSSRLLTFWALQIAAGIVEKFWIGK
jgi:hypothetical protein